MQYVRATVVFLICIAVVHNLNLFRQQTDVDRSGDNVAAFDHSLQQLRQMLPKKGTVGYIADAPTSEITHDAGEMRRYYLTEYSLAPLVVALGSGPSLVIGNFPGGSSAVPQDSNLVLIRDFGNGVMLFGKGSE